MACPFVGQLITDGWEEWADPEAEEHDHYQGHGAKVEEAEDRRDSGALESKPHPKDHVHPHIQKRAKVTP